MTPTDPAAVHAKWPTVTEILATDMRRANDELDRRNLRRAKRAKQSSKRKDRLMAESQNRGYAVVADLIQRGIRHCTTPGVIAYRKECEALRKRRVGLFAKLRS